MPPLLSATPPFKPRVIIYAQTHFHNGNYVSLLPLLTEETGVTHVIVAAIHINSPPGNIHLNNDPLDAPKHVILWNEVRQLQTAGIKVLGMVGGAAKGSFERLDGSNKSFEAYYQPFKKQIEWAKLDGVDLDVEEDMSLAGIIRLIDRLRNDFGPDFLITLAPVATALLGGRHLSGFSYFELEKAFGRHIAWYNTQFYCGWGSAETTEHYDTIMAMGWNPQKVVMGLLTNPGNGAGWVVDDLLMAIVVVLADDYEGFGGVMGWELLKTVVISSKATHSEFGAHTSAETVAQAFGSSVKDKIILITGVNPMDIGGTTAKALAIQHPKILILVGRSAEKPDTVAKETRNIDASVETHFVHLDLAFTASVRKATSAYSAKQLNIIINSGGIPGLPNRELSADGIELQFACNHIGYFLFANLLMSKILAAAATSSAGATRVMKVTSWGQTFSLVRFSDTNFEKVDTDIPEPERWNSELAKQTKLYDGQQQRESPAPGYFPFAAYGASKTANIPMAVELNQKLATKGVSSFAILDVASNEQIDRKNTSEGSSTSFVAALIPALALKTDSQRTYLPDCQIAPVAAWAQDGSAAARLSEPSEKLVGEKFAI